MQVEIKSGFQFLVALFLILASTLEISQPARAQGFEHNILTGGPNGTYIQIGRDLSRVGEKCGLPLIVRESAGSLENFLGVRQRRYTQFGIVQSDVLEYLKTYAGEDRSIARAVAGVRIAFPLYNEEVHVLARKEIAELGGLAGRKVSIGVEDSGTFLTASLVLDLTGIAPSERVTQNAVDSLAALQAGEIDALFYVSGAPTKLFDSAAIDGERFHLLPIDDPTLQAIYQPTEIPGGTYPFQSNAVNVIAVKAVLMTYEFDPSINWYHRASCKAVSDLVHIVTSRFDEFKATGHPKWKDVNLIDLPPGWSVSECVAAGLSSDYSVSCIDEEPASAAIPEESDINAVYRQRICASIGC
ncbi:TAXI family TRAP transporter solute-binding subunit [Rhodobacteraceae bacterium NNCM2]|nr:TAXI family TRAP transporter solute-binding subunit [Coraliihabitans acroporae]